MRLDLVPRCLDLMPAGLHIAGLFVKIVCLSVDNQESGYEFTIVIGVLPAIAVLMPGIGVIKSNRQLRIEAACALVFHCGRAAGHIRP